ncbi:MAG TPA: hypothetical protein VGV09_20775, partial [Steroidobacteraceae bacterium]|nr:hypothetical protein [Steroidobacteraceae bacterium]
MNDTALLLAPDTRVTCPACDREFSLEQGFARQALEAVETASASALADLKDQERAVVEKRAQQLAADQAKAAQRQVEDLQKILSTQTDAHSKALAEMHQREAAIETRVQEAAAARAAELMAGERRDNDKRLADSNVQLKQLREEQLALREERQRLRDEKDALTLEVHRQVDAKLAERETAARTQEQEKAKLDKAELQKKLD